MSARTNLRTRADAAGYTLELGGARSDIDTFIASWRVKNAWERRTVQIKWASNDQRVLTVLVNGHPMGSTRAIAETAIDNLERVRTMTTVSDR